MVALPDGGHVLCGHYTQGWALGGTALPALGEADFFVARYDAGGALLWAKAGGSILSDEINAVSAADDGSTVVVGSFWLSAYFGDTLVQAGQSGKVLFVWKLDAAGQTQWIKVINGSGSLKALSGVATDAAGQIWLSGYFSGQLYLQGDTLSAAPGTTHLLVAKLDADGLLLQAEHSGQTDNTRALHIGLHPDGGCVVAGMFDGFTTLAGQTFRAETGDRDVFLVRYDDDLQAVWARKAGGVHDDDVRTLAVGDTGDVYIGGFFIGVIALSGELAIQSQTGQADGFLLKYSADGTPLWGRSIGGPLRQQVSGIAIHDGRPVLSGFYLGDMAVDGQVLAGDPSLFRGFVAVFSTGGTLDWWVSAGSSENLYPQAILAFDDGRVTAFGSFQGSATFDEEIYTAVGDFDIFTAQVASVLTPTLAVTPQTSTFRIFPNPTTGLLYLDTPLAQYTVEVFNLSGQMVLRAQHARQIDLGCLGAGMYLVRVGGIVQRVVVR